MDGSPMNNERCANDGKGAVTVWCFGTICRALPSWVAAGAMLFGGGLAAQAQSIVPEDKCTVSGTTVACTGDLSGGVQVDDDNSGIYTALDIRGPTGNIAPAEGTAGIEFDTAVSEGVYDIDLTVDTGGFDIVTRGESSDGVRLDHIYGNRYAEVKVDVTGDIRTAGSGSDGIEVRYAGSGSGHTWVVMNGNIATTGQYSRGIHANSRDRLTIEMTGDIKTEGLESDGIYARSESTGIVEIVVAGNIETEGADSDGIYARSDSTGIVEIVVAGNIETEGADSDGIEAKSGGDIRITLHGGSVISDRSAGIRFDDNDASNTLTILGPVTISGGSYDVQGGSGNETIDNYGTLTTPGTIYLGDGNNAFNNHAGATFNSGAEVFLGSDDEDLFSNAGDLSPGGADAVQTTSLVGHFVNEEDGTFTVTIDDTGSDRLDVSGTAELRGTVRVRGVYNENVDSIDGRYTILDATGEMTGTFEGVMNTLFMDYGLHYDLTENRVDLYFERKGGVTFLGFAGTVNQRAVASVLDGLAPANAIVREVMSVATQEEVRAAYDGLSGEVHASLKGALMDAVQGTVAAVESRMWSGGAGARSSAFGMSSPVVGQGGIWVAGYDASGETNATAGTARMETDRRGAVFGVDRAVGGGWRLGILGGYGRTEVSQRARLSSGSVDTRSVGVYGGVASGASRFGFGAVYDDHGVDARRTVRIGDLSQRLSADYDARSWQFFAEAGHEIRSGRVTLEPFAGVSSIHLDTDGFSERGGGAALASSSDTDSMTFATLGLRHATQMDGTVRLRGLAGWRHASGDVEASSSFTMSGGPAFTVAGAPAAEEALIAELGLDAELSDRVVLGVAYKGRYGGGGEHGVHAGLTVRF